MNDNVAQVTPDRGEWQTPEALARTKRAEMITIGVGVAHALLLVLAYLLVRLYAPGPDATSDEIAEFYSDDGKKRLVLIAGIYLIPFAGIAYIWFVVALRTFLQGEVRKLSLLFSDVVLVCGIIYVTLLFCAGAALSLVALDPSLDNDAIVGEMSRQFSQYGSSLFMIFAMRMAAMTVFAISNISRQHEAVFPRWFAPVSIVIGLLLLLSASVDPLLILVFPLWLTVFCGLLIRHIRKVPDGLSGPVLNSKGGVTT